MWFIIVVIFPSFPHTLHTFSLLPLSSVSLSIIIDFTCWSKLSKSVLLVASSVRASASSLASCMIPFLRPTSLFKEKWFGADKYLGDSGWDSCFVGFEKISILFFSSGLVHIVCVLMAVNVWVFIRDSMWEKCARLSHPRAFKGNIKFTQLSQNLISQWWRTSWRNLIFEGNNLLICFQFETFNFVKICRKVWAEHRMVEAASSYIVNGGIFQSKTCMSVM